MNLIPPPPSQQRPSRPASVSLLACMVLIIAVLYWIRLIQSIALWDFLAGLLPFSPAYLTVSGFVLGITWLVIVIGLWLGWRWVPAGTMLTSLLYCLYLWADRLLLQNPQSRPPDELFLFGQMLFFLMLVYWILSRRKVKIFFGVIR